jgi:hypothetical protein
MVSLSAATKPERKKKEKNRLSIEDKKVFAVQRSHVIIKEEPTIEEMNDKDYD